MGAAEPVTAVPHEIGLVIEGVVDTEWRYDLRRRRSSSLVITKNVQVPSAGRTSLILS